MANISDLVVRITAITKDFDRAIDTSTKVLQGIQKTASNTITVVGGISTLTTGNLAPQLATVSGSMQGVSVSSKTAVASLDLVAVAMSHAASVTGLLSVAAGTTAKIGGEIAGGLGDASKVLSMAVVQVMGLKYAVVILAGAFRLAADGVRVLMIPITALMSVLKFLGNVIYAATLPLRLLASAVGSVLMAFSSLAKTLVTLWMKAKALKLAIGWLSSAFGQLPIKAQLAIGALLGMGVASRAVSTGMRVAGTAVKLLAVPLAFLVGPLYAVAVGVAQLTITTGGLGMAFRATGSAAMWFGRTIKAVVIGAMSAVTAAVGAALSALGALAGVMLAFAVVASVKLAASAETLALQFKVLTGSADTAAKILKDLDQFAAETPFQKMEIGEAARKLIAFGSSAETVFDELRVIGDIAAATGQPIGELAELYGKAQVQGRLFGEDINQLTGRGIPIIQELAKQFGVAESEVKGLVKEGKIGFPELQIALQSMTGEGGRFGGMMNELSQTTAGRWSTLVDQVLLLGTAIGNELLPVANDLITWASNMIAHTDGFGNAFSSALQPALKFITTVFGFLEDVGTVAGIVVGNFGTLWEGMFEDIPKYASAAFQWITDSAGIVLANIGTMISNLYNSINTAGLRLGEEIAFKLGLSDEVLNIAKAAQKPMQALKPMAPVVPGEAVQGVVDDISRALEANAAKRASGLGPAAEQDTKTKDRMALPIGKKDGPQDGEVVKKAGAFAQGSQEAYSAIVSAMRGGNEQVKATNNVAMVIRREVGQPLRQMASGVNRPIVVEAFA